MPQAPFFVSHELTRSPIFARSRRIITNPAVWNMRTIYAPLPAGSRSQNEIKARRVMAGVRQFLDTSMPVTMAEIGDLKGVKKPKIGGRPRKISIIPAMKQLVAPISIPNKIPVRGARIQPRLKEAPGIPRIGPNGIRSAVAFRAANTEI